VNCHLLLGFQMQYNNSDLLSPETQQQFLQIPCVVWLWKTQVVILIILFIFALVHSGLASLRGEGEKLVGERAYRVLYAVLSLPLAVSAVVCNLQSPSNFKEHFYDFAVILRIFQLPLVMSWHSFVGSAPHMTNHTCCWPLGLELSRKKILLELKGDWCWGQVYFINHRSDGLQLWQVQTVPGVHELVWVVSFVSFFFLYPSTFNLLEVAAVDKPKMHMWETGIMRITRHPQVIFFLVKLVQAYNIDTSSCVKFLNFKFLKMLSISSL